MHRATTLAEAFAAAAGAAQSGDVVLLSPACTSFDAYPNFEQRGDEFRRLVENYQERRVRRMKNYRLQAGQAGLRHPGNGAGAGVIGLIFVYSSSFAIALGDFGDVNYFFFRQLGALLIGGIAMLVAMRFDYHRLRVLSPILMLVAVSEPDGRARHRQRRLRRPALD